MSMFHELMMRKKVEEMPLTVVGTPTIVDGVVSGFDSSNNLQSSFSFTNSFKGKIRAKVNSDETSNFGGLFRLLSSSTPAKRFTIEIFSTNRIRIYHYDESSSSNVNESIFGLSLGNIWIDYYFDYDLSSKTLNVYAKNISDGTIIFTKTYTNCLLESGTITFGYVYAGYEGEIDINNSNVVLDGTKYIFTIGA